MLYIILMIEPCTLIKTNHVYMASLITVFDGYSCIANPIKLSLRPRFLFGSAYN